MSKLRLIIVAALCCVLAACGSHGSSDTTGAEAKAKAIASSSANTQAETQVKAEITKCVNGTPITKLASSTGRQHVLDCLKALVPPDKQDRAEQCFAHAAIADKVWHKTGRTKFEDTDAAKCVTDATGTVSAKPKPSASSSK